MISWGTLRNLRPIWLCALRIFSTSTISSHPASGKKKKTTKTLVSNKLLLLLSVFTEISQIYIYTWSSFLWEKPRKCQVPSKGLCNLLSHQGRMRASPFHPLIRVVSFRISAPLVGVWWRLRVVLFCFIIFFRLVLICIFWSVYLPSLYLLWWNVCSGLLLIF